MLPILLSVALPRDTAPVLRIAGGQVEITEGSRTLRVPLRAAPVKTPPVSFRKDKVFVVWDERGLTIRTPKRVLTTRFEEYGTSPKLFSKEEIRANVAAFKRGARGKEADALAGAVRLGSRIYLLPRWNAKSGPWLEALVSVDLDGEAPKPMLLGRFRGFTPRSDGMDKNALGTIDSRIVTVTKGPESWGVAAYAPVAKRFGYVPLGTGLLWFDGDSFAEKTDYGTTIAGTVDRKGLRRTLRLESSASPVQRAAVEGVVTFLAPREADTTLVADLKSGAQLGLPSPIVTLSVPGSPDRLLALDSRAPKRAWLLVRGADWRILARWTAEGGSSTGEPPL